MGGCINNGQQKVAIDRKSDRYGDIAFSMHEKKCNKRITYLIVTREVQE